ncbi:hypothetical protein HDU83_003650 [Entophlyctis luteolus]|nr:hypothetical protein HDU83_003650 [Entophlyctis luteolus]
MSAFFDQPAAHHNPLHDPFPPTTMTAESAVLGKYTVSRPVLESANSGWSKRKSFPSEDLTDMMEISPASREGFRYIGDGFFYSTYSPTPTAQFIRAAGMALEGSLFDYQIADAVNALFGSCTPGDIRVSYDAIVASESRGGAAVGKLESDLSIGVFTSKGNYQLGLYENDMSTTPHRMLGNVLWAAWYWNLGAYALLCVWAAVLTYYIPLASLAASPIPENQRLGDTYAWCAETIGLSFATVGLARIIVSLCGGYTHFATALAISFIGVAIIGLSRNSIARAYFARSAEPHKKSS